MKKGLLLFAVIVVFMAIFLFREFAEQEEVHTVGVLLTGENRIDKLEGLKAGLEDLGYETEEMVFIVYEGEEEAELLEPYARELVAEDDVQVIASFGGIETQVLAEVMDDVGKTIPTVFIGMAAPLETGIISDFRHPGGNFTGINNYHMNLSAKRLELFTDMVPEVERVILLYSEGIDISRRSLALTEEAAERLSLPIVPFHVSDELDEEELVSIVQPGDGLMTLPSFQIEGLTEEIVSFAKDENLPTMGMYDYEVEAGFLLGYGSSFYEQGLQAARQISLILQGNDPKDIPVELPDQISFYMNEDVREQLNVTVDENLLKLVDPIRNGGVGE
ncbi:ABC transporter substrate-binding protein [Salipaludibacillus daqingensis]|uniref:ABC transporter substrate-binding protein n=1 Tax=Salipaludibacillus daqingensis TaxID=3041001 RepID=UPI002472FA33|nr:ABC transporter substrate-binding protein [Salipaludibacillus daqingensis]